MSKLFYSLGVAKQTALAVTRGETLCSWGRGVVVWKGEGRGRLSEAISWS
jgi:hypothetical protein